MSTRGVETARRTVGAFLPRQGRRIRRSSPSSQPQVELLKLIFLPAPGEDFVDIPENFFGVGGEEDITIQTVTWPDVELPLPRNVTEGEARGNVILTVKPIFGVSPTVPETEEPFTFVPEPEEPFTFAPDRGATAFPEAENRTGETAGPWGVPPTPGPAFTAFTSEDHVVQVTAVPGATEVSGQPRLPGGKCLPLGGLHGGWGAGGKNLAYLKDPCLQLSLRPGPSLPPLRLGSPYLQNKGVGQRVTSMLFCHKEFPSNEVIGGNRSICQAGKNATWV